MKVSHATSRELAFLVIRRLVELESENKDLRARIAQLQPKHSQRLIGFDRS